MRTRHRFSTLLLLAVAGLAFGAAAPAQTGSGPNAVYWNGTVKGQSPERPRALINNVDGEPPARVSDMQWTEWGGDVAQGTGNLSLFLPGSSTIRVHVTLDRKVNCGGWNVYTAWTLTLPGGSKVPRGFRSVRIRREPCSPGPCPLLRTTCTHADEDRTLTHYDPRPLGARARFFDVRWRSAGATATGRGLLRRERSFGARSGREDPWLYPVKIRLSDPRWCDFRVVHAVMTLTTYGRGAHRDYDLRSRRKVRPPRSVVRRLLRAIDRPGTARHSDTYEASRCEPSRAVPPPVTP